MKIIYNSELLISVTWPKTTPWKKIYIIYTNISAITLSELFKRPRVRQVFKVSGLFFPTFTHISWAAGLRAVTQMQSVHCAICSSPSNFSVLIHVMFSHISDCRYSHFKQKWLHLPATPTAAPLCRSCGGIFFFFFLGSDAYRHWGVTIARHTVYIQVSSFTFHHVLTESKGSRRVYGGSARRPGFSRRYARNECEKWKCASGENSWILLMAFPYA